METRSEDMPLSLPPALLEEMQAAAEAEHRPAKDILREAVERYLEQRRQDSEAEPVTAERARLAAERIRQLRKGNFLPEGVTIRDLIDEGRA